MLIWLGGRATPVFCLVILVYGAHAGTELRTKGSHNLANGRVGAAPARIGWTATPQPVAVKDMRSDVLDK